MEPQILSEADITSGQWLPEREALVATGLSLSSLTSRRYRGTIAARPRRLVKGGGRDWWYSAADLRRLVPLAAPAGELRAPAGQSAPESSASNSYTELELSFARSEAREQELAALRAKMGGELELAQTQLAAAASEIERLRTLVGQLTTALAAFAQVPRS